METPTSRHRKSRTACDRCYNLKERCERESSSLPCSRCERLGWECLSVRPVLPVGRRKRREKESALKVKSGKGRKFEQTQLDTSACLDALPDLQPEERELLQFLLTQPEGLDPFVVCSSFQAEQQHLLAIQLPTALPLLKDAYLACAFALKQLQSGSGVNTSTCIGYITKAMSTLRSLPVLSSQDIAICHTLGSLLAFSVYFFVGIGVDNICRYCLGTTSTFTGGTIANSHEDSWQSFLVLLETTDCLVYRRKPTRTLRGPPTSFIDRHLGLSSPLLLYYSDLCVISNSLLNETDDCIQAHLHMQLDRIHTALESWQPSHMDQLVENFESADIVNLLAQAKVYRLGALLVAHRLRFPFGYEDIQAEIWSREAMMELELAKRVTKRSLRFVTLPFIIAAVEIREKTLRLQTLERVDDFVDHFAPFVRQATKTFLSRVWDERDLNVTSRWFDSIHKPCPVMDSIDAEFLGSL